MVKYCSASSKNCSCVLEEREMGRLYGFFDARFELLNMSNNVSNTLMKFDVANACCGNSLFATSTLRATATECDRTCAALDTSISLKAGMFICESVSRGQ